MGLGFKSSSDYNGRPIFIEGDNHRLQDYPGGGTLDKTGLVDGQELPKGTFVNFDEGTRKFKVLKAASIYEDAAAGATSYKIKKGSNLATSDVVSLAVGGASYAITGTIDTSNAAYDTITVTTSLGAATAGDTLFHSAASGAAAGALKYSPNGMLKDSMFVGDNESVSIIWGGQCYNRRLPAKATTAIQNALAFMKFLEQR